ncbi:MAG: hypothetical protein LBK60_08575 [Verrucomicrobiales bacterium]|jgi:SSS family solute:Na+ symporter|nr:hypothetical protein [Verrucomicrobiales bacterium]
MRLVDWLLILIPVSVALGAALHARRYVKTVADFMSGRRLAGRYLLTIASAELQAGAVVFVASFEKIARSGFVMTWWEFILAPAAIIMGITGFVSYRLRETRVLTLAQFFELRYSKRFRFFAGVVGFFAGAVNFGIIPAIGARCVGYFLGLPEFVSVLAVPVPTFMLLMAGFLGVSVFIALSGGMITLIIVNCVEGIMGQLFYLVIIGALLCLFDWSQISEVLQMRGAGESMLNPFDSFKTKDFNIWLALMGLFAQVYGWRAWQNASGYTAAPLTPHEGRMGMVLGSWATLGKGAVVALLGVCALTFLQHPDFAAPAAAAREAVEQISDSRIREQMAPPIALAHLLPVGVKGLLCAVLLMGVFGGDATHLHSWSSIFVQDVLVPLRKKPFGTREHLRVLRGAIVGVAVFAFLFGCLFRQIDYVFLWWTVTTAIYVGGAGAAIIGGLYWKKGTTAAAWAAMITGSVLSVGGIVAKKLHEGFPLNGAQISFFAILIAITVYAVVSLLTCRQNFNMDRMLHRGAYAGVKRLVGDQAPGPRRKVHWGKLIGLDEHFTLGDKCIAAGLFGWTLFWCLVAAGGSIWNGISPWSVEVWSAFWHIVAIMVPLIIASVTGVWFAIGGARDMKRFFARLKETASNPLDDGTVVNNQNLDEYLASQERQEPGHNG